ncbi:hypothetical protein MAM1_0023d01938 [Mucor ambiguus]|uniref:F-box domain-containing protein n=1 Tax=Mucor ambiguus TaxID=91626 RepID=A0A0C9M6Q3_9FUNG|nr:hypothetical protein MAM1_0023d01938 [Mucor ambiguus]
MPNTKFAEIRSVTNTSITLSNHGALQRSKDGRRGQVNLDMNICTGLLMVSSIIIMTTMIACCVQGKTAKLGINLPPPPKALTATNGGIDLTKYIGDQKLPKLTMHLLELGSFTDTKTLPRMSQGTKASIMASSWEEIPQELLESIIDKIGDDCAIIATTTRNHCLLQLQLTCKRWSSIAKEAFYNEEFEINVNLAKKLISRTRNRRQQLWLKKILITYELAIDPSLKKLLSLCPKLTHLRVLERSSNSSYSYVSTDAFGSTYSIDERESFYSALTMLSHHHHLANLRKIEFQLEAPRLSQLLIHHQQAMLQLRHSLTHLYIADDSECHDDDQFSQKILGWFDELQNFAWLTSLELCLAYFSCLQNMDLWIQKIGPTITTLCITVKNTAPHLYPKRVDLATIVRHAPLKLLRLDIDDLQSEDLEYIKYKFDRVSDLQITLTESSGSMCQFYAYLARLPKYSIQDMCIPSNRLHDTMMDLKDYFHITHLKFSNNIQFAASETIHISLNCLAGPKDGNPGQACLSLIVDTDELETSVEIVCQVLNEDVVELQICHPHEELLILQSYEFEACYDQAAAVCIGLRLLPSLKSLIASYPGLNFTDSIVRPGELKLSLNYLQLGNFTDLNFFFPLSQRIEHIERWVAPEFTLYGADEERYNYFVSMPYTTFGEIKIDSICTTRFIIALYTSSAIIYHEVGVGSNLELPTRDEFDSEFYEADLEDPDHVGIIRIDCFDVKKLKIGFTTLIIDHP